jgi:hypothetical protein
MAIRLKKPRARTAEAFFIMEKIIADTPQSIAWDQIQRVSTVI